MGTDVTVIVSVPGDACEVAGVHVGDPSASAPWSAPTVTLAVQVTATLAATVWSFARIVIARWEMVTLSVGDVSV